MDRRKLLKGFLVVIQLAGILGIAGICGYLLLRYCVYAEREVSERVQAPGGNDGGKDNSLQIRVRIMDSDFSEDVHSELSLSASGGMKAARRNRERALLQADGWNGKEETEIQITPEDLEAQEVLILEPAGDFPITVNSLIRAGGTPEYYGRLYVWREREGLALLNVLPLEQYLYSVVSSEMPSDYPLEAQKAQAVCARTYAVNCMNQRAEEILAEDVTDSVDFQVYNNYGMTDISKQAVDETAGEILPIENIQYYSTSCLSEHRTDLDSDKAFEAFLSEAPAQGAEYGSRWLRWEMEVSKEVLLGKIEEEYPGWAAAETGDEAVEVTVTSRRGDGQVQELRISCGTGEVVVEGEYDVREILGIPQAQITLLDGSQTKGMKLLPSAFFCITGEEQDGVEEFVIQGGGYGHGNGMSQCGAAAMAEKGVDYKAIIGYYYSIMTVYL